MKFFRISIMIEKSKFMNKKFKKKIVTKTINEQNIFQCKKIMDIKLHEIKYNALK